MNSNDPQNLDTPIWGARAIGAVLNLTERQAWHQLEKRKLDAKKVGKTWVSTPRRLLASIFGDEAAA